MLEDFLHDLVEPFGTLERELDRPKQNCVVEGVPRLAAATTGTSHDCNAAT